jgi:hypothetical protein
MMALKIPSVGISFGALAPGSAAELFMGALARSLQAEAAEERGMR